MFCKHSARCEIPLSESGGARSEIAVAGVCAAALLVSTTARWPYFVYTLLRVLICVCSIYIAVRRHEERRTLWVWVFAATGLLFNPVMPVRLVRSDWRTLDLIVACFFVGWAAYLTIMMARVDHK